MPNRKPPPEDLSSIDPAILEVARPYSNTKMRIPADARMSENVQDTRGEAAIYNNKLAMQRERGEREQTSRERRAPKPALTQIERDIDETVRRNRMNAGGLREGMSPREEREVLDEGRSPGYDLWKKRQDFDELMERVAREGRSSGKDARGLEDLVEKSANGYAKGGMVRKKTGSRGDGCCTRGHTKGKMY